jgi:hypothetical protein
MPCTDEACLNEHTVQVVDCSSGNRQIQRASLAGVTHADIPEGYELPSRMESPNVSCCFRFHESQ